MTKTKFALNIECRTCFNASKGLNPLTTTMCYYTTRIKSYGELIEEVTKINTKYDKHPEFPQFICNKCLRYLKSAHKFIKQAKEVNEKLYSMLNKKLDCLQETQIDLEQDIEIKVKSNGQELEEKTDCLHEPQIDVETVLDIKVEDIDVETTIAYLDRLQETQMHIESTIKLKDENNGQEEQLIKESILNNTEALTKLDLEFKLEVPEDGSGVLNTSIDKLSGAKKVDIKEAIPLKDVLEATSKQNESMSEDEDDYDADDIFDKDFSKPDDGLSDSDIESESSNDSDWAKETATANTKDNESKAKAVRSKKIKEKSVDDNIPTPCDQCDRVFPNSRLLGRHKRLTHIPKELKVQCPYCTAKFGRRHNMNVHMRSHHKDQPVEEHIAQQRKFPRPFACEKCNGTYTSKYSLFAHMKLKHNPKKRFLCTLCGFKLDTQSNLDVHIRRHTGEKPYKCDLCERAFYKPSDVQVHRRSHTGEKPFKCTICEKPFVRSNKLKIHMRTHSNERPYKCDQCEKAFKHSKDLNKHKRIHTGERPYTCGVQLNQ